MAEKHLFLVADDGESAELLAELADKGIKSVALGEPGEALEAMRQRLEEMELRLRALERDQESGFRVQQAMMPKSPTAINGLTFAHRLFPSMIVSGDFIDYFELPDGQAVFYIADVAGHGASSAFVTVLLKSLSRPLRERFGGFGGLAEALAWLNGELLAWRLEQHVTMFFGLIDPKKSSLSYCNAGHFPGTILCHSGQARFLETGGQPLGLYAEPQFQSHELALPGAFAIVMISDGVFEVMPQASLAAKEAALLSVVRGHCKELDSLVAELGVHQAQRIPDDIAVFTVASGR